MRDRRDRSLVLRCGRWQWQTTAAREAGDDVWVATQDVPRTVGHPFYARLNQILDKHDFDGYVEELCQRFYANDVGRPGLPPSRYWLIGYFEGFRQVIRLVLGQSLLVTAVGIGTASAGAIVVTRYLGNMQFGLTRSIQRHSSRCP
jgi:hypothetical protein